MGFFGVLAAVSLLAVARWRSGAFLLGVLPAVHLSLALAGGVMIATALLAAPAARTRAVAAWPAFAAGLEFGFTDVLVPAGWRLELEPLAASDTLDCLRSRATSVDR